MGGGPDDDDRFIGGEGEFRGHRDQVLLFASPDTRNRGGKGPKRPISLRRRFWSSHVWRGISWERLSVEEGRWRWRASQSDGVEIEPVWMSASGDNTSCGFVVRPEILPGEAI